MSELLSSLNTVGSGSYAQEDVHFLLQPMQMEVTDVQEKERLIQTNRKHYSEMISMENAPTEVHKSLYARAMVQNGKRMAVDVQALALALNAAYTGKSIALVSFVRAGLPLGVLLRRALVEMGRDAHHYGVSIIRDRGIDTVALEAIIRLHGAENVVFVDGWTGKGRSPANSSGRWAQTSASLTIHGSLSWRTRAGAPGWQLPPRTGSFLPEYWEPQSPGWFPDPSGRQRAGSMAALFTTICMSTT